MSNTRSFNLCLALVALLVASGAKAQVDPPDLTQALFTVSPWFIATTLVLGEPNANAEITLESQSDAELSVSILSTFDWLNPSVSSLTLDANGTATFSAEISCTTPGISSGVLSLVLQNDATTELFLPVQRTCEVPTLELEILTPLDKTTGVVGFSVGAALVWRLNSIWDAHPAQEYSFAASTGVTVTESTGLVAVNRITVNTVTFACRTEGTFTLFVILNLASKPLEWQIDCQTGRPGIRPESPALQLQADAGTEEIFFLTLLNEFESSFLTDYSLTTDTAWLELLQSGGSMPSPSKDFVVGIVKCVNPGQFVGSIQIQSEATRIPELVTMPVVLTCLRPELEIVQLGFESQQRNGVRQLTRATLNWTIKSTWIPNDQLPYSVVVPEAVQVASDKAVVGLNDPISTTLSYTCGGSEERNTFDIQVNVGSASRTFYWRVNCLDSPIGVIVDVDEVNQTLDVSQAATTNVHIALTNLFDSSNSIQIAPSDAFIVLDRTELTIAPRHTERIPVTLTCSSPGKLTGTILIADSSSPPKSISIPVTLLCTAPAFTVVFNTLPSNAHQDIPRWATTELNWSLQSYWPNPQSVEFILSVAEGVQITNPSGMLMPNGGSSNHDLEFQCTSMGTIHLPITLTVDSQTHTIYWEVRCIESQPVTAVQLDFFQGPRVASVEYSSIATGWSLTSDHALRSGMVSSRATIVEVNVQHTTARAEPVQFSLLQPMPKTHEALSVTTFAVGDTWTTRSIFLLRSEDVIPAQAWEVLVLSLLPNEGRARLSRSFLDNWEVNVLPTMQIQFIPIQFESVPTSVDTALIMQQTRDYLPFGVLSGELVDNLQPPDNVTSAEELAAYLLTVWQEKGADPHLLLHGLYSSANVSPDVCGVGEVDGNVAISRTSKECMDRVTATHEIGHNLSLKHAPCGSQLNGVDEDFPYADGSIGNEFGYFTSNRQRVESSHDVFDIMSYCEPTFISQYYFAQASQNLEQRNPSESEVSSALNTEPVAALQAGPSPGIVFTGTLDPTGKWLVHFIGSIRTATHRERPNDQADFKLALYDGQTNQPIASNAFHLRTFSHSKQKFWSVVLKEPIRLGLTMHIVDAEGNTVYRRDLDSVAREISVTQEIIRVE